MLRGGDINCYSGHCCLGKFVTVSQTESNVFGISKIISLRYYVRSERRSGITLCAEISDLRIT